MTIENEKIKNCDLKTTFFSRLTFYKTGILTLATGIATSTLYAGSKPENIRWNVLFFISDEHSPHFMSIDNQSPQNIFTPNLERLAKGGMVFVKTYTAYPVCAPTRTSIICGQYPQVHGQTGNSTYLTECGPTGKAPSLAHIFRNAGYNTALIGKTHSNMQLWDSNPGMLYQDKELFLGFDYRLEQCVSSAHPSVPGHIPSDSVWNQKRSTYLFQYPEALKGQPSPAWEQAVMVEANKYVGKGEYMFNTANLGHAANHGDGELDFDALEYLEQYSKGQVNNSFKINNPAAPFFIYVAPVQPHWPAASPNMQDSIDFYAMYSGRPEDDNGTYRYKSEMRKKIVPADLTPDELKNTMKGWPGYGTVHDGEISPATFRLTRARYSSAVSWIDHLLGKLMDKLEQLPDPNNPGKKLSETTIVVYTSDHGDMMGEKYRLAKMVMQEASDRVPFIIRMPGVVPSGQRSNILVNHVDMFPTIAGLCNLGSKLPSGISGKDLSVAVIHNNASLGPERTFSVAKLNSDPKVHPGYVMGRSQRFKLIRLSAKQANGLPYMALFDMDNDPHETKNLADDPRFTDVLNRESAAIDTFLLKFGVPPVNLKVGD